MINYRMIMTFYVLSTAVVAEFDPYQMNGGLVSAVAGADFVVMATDTRLSESYNILGRRHVSSRLWTPSGTLDASLYEQQETTTSSSSVVEEHADIPSVWIASAGCQADCEGLKRKFRSHLRAAHASLSSPDMTANALSHELYSRRGFPYYAFCLVAGWNAASGGCVYAYDAIGSYERVAVASAGTGNHLLQPILDRLFAEETPKTTNCPSPEVAVQRLIQAYRAVAEREIAVGDSLVLVSMRKTSDGKWETKRWISPLKSH